MTSARDDTGSITAFVAIIAFALVMVAGMAYDGGQVVAAQAKARATASKAARAGAQEIDSDLLRSAGRPVLDRSKAMRAAETYLAEAGVTGTVRVSADTVEVTVRINQPMRILPVGDRIVVATDTATATDGNDS